MLEKIMEEEKMNIDFWHYMCSQRLIKPEEPVDEWEEIYSKMHKHREVD